MSSEMYSFGPMMMPPMASPWPHRYLVAEWTDTVTPSGSGCCSAGEAKVLSIMVGIPRAFASRASAAMSTISRMGLLGVSK